MSSQPLVSVVIPAYNRAGAIIRTLDDVFNQTYKDFEVIVVDDGSTDDTQAVLQRYGNNIRVILQENAGPAAARNRGIEASRGEIIAFQDSDDLWQSTKLERQVRLLNRVGESVPCCICNVLLKNFSGSGIDDCSFNVSLIRPKYEEGVWLNVAEVLASRTIMFNQGAAVRRKVLEKAGGFDVTLRYLEDYGLAMKVAIEGPWAYVREPLAIWTSDSSDSLTKKASGDVRIRCECYLSVLECSLAAAENRGDSNVVLQLIKSAEHGRRGLKFYDMRHSGSRPRKAMARLLDSCEHLRSGARRISPWFPRIREITCEEFVK